MKENKLEIVVGYPPVYEEASKHFEIDPRETLFTYGDKLYNPGNIHVDQALIAHEETHQRQQAERGGPEKWWKEYIELPIFRMHQESEAYANQYKEYCYHVGDRNKRYRYLHTIAGYLASPLYKLGITTNTAMDAIKQWL